MAEHKKHHPFKRSHVDWHHDGSATMHHEHEEGPHKDVTHAVGDLDGVHDSLENHMGAPNPGEAEIPAAPAATAMPAPAAAGM